MGKGKRHIKTIDEMTTEEEVLERIRTQTNTLNNKIEYFRENDVRTFFDILDAYIGDDIERLPSGKFSKGKLQYEGKDILELKYIASALTEINKNQIYGSPKKFEKYGDKGIKWITEFIIDEFVDNGDYDMQYVLSRISDRKFIKMVTQMLNDKNDYIPSEQKIKQCFLDYDSTMIQNSKTRMKKLQAIDRNLSEGRNKENR